MGGLFLIALVLIAYAIYSTRKSLPKGPIAPPEVLSRNQWKSDLATQKQLDYIESLGGTAPRGAITKGKASEILDRLLPAEEEDLQVLRFFKVSTRGLGERAAREAAESLLSDPDNLKKWKARAPSQEIREFFRFFGLKLPPGTGHDDAEILQRQHMDGLRETEPTKMEDWLHYIALLDDLADPEYREGFDIKKPPITLVRKVIAQLLEEGWTYARLRDDEDIFIERLIEAQPSIEK